MECKMHRHLKNYQLNNPHLGLKQPHTHTHPPHTPPNRHFAFFWSRSLWLFLFTLHKYLVNFKNFFLTPPLITIWLSSLQVLNKLLTSTSCETMVNKAKARGCLIIITDILHIWTIIFLIIIKQNVHRNLHAQYFRTAMVSDTLRWQLNCNVSSGHTYTL